MKARGRHITYIRPQEPLRCAPCWKCGFLLAARSAAQLRSVGWARVVKEEPAVTAGAIPHVITSDPGGFVCKTCVGTWKGAVPELDPAVDQDLFMKLNRVPETAFPRVGGEGKKHRRTSRAEKHAESS